MRFIHNLKNRKAWKREPQRADLEEASVPAAEKEELCSGRAFLFCGEDSLEAIMQTLCKAFGISSEGTGNTLDVRNQAGGVHFLVAAKDMGEAARSYIDDQVKRTWGHFYGVLTEHKDIKTNLLYQIQRTGGFAVLDYSFAGEAGRGSFEAFLNLFSPAMDKLEGALLLPGGSGKRDGFYRKGWAGGLELILSEWGESEAADYLPPQKFTMTADERRVFEDQVERRRKNRFILVEKRIYVPVDYPLIESERKTFIRTPEEIAERAAALLLVSLYSECLLGEKMSPEKSYDFVRASVESFGAERLFSSKERAYLHDPHSTERERIAFSWRYEALTVMEWALGLTGELEFPDHICDVSQAVRLLDKCRTVEDILGMAEPRTAGELLDECDLAVCLDWACADTRSHNLPAPAGMNGRVAAERRKALDWLVGIRESAPWDEVAVGT